MRRCINGELNAGTIPDSPEHTDRGWYTHSCINSLAPVPCSRKEGLLPSVSCKTLLPFPLHVSFLLSGSWKWRQLRTEPGAPGHEFPALCSGLSWGWAQHRESDSSCFILKDKGNIFVTVSSASSIFSLKILWHLCPLDSHQWSWTPSIYFFLLKCLHK